MDVVDDTVTSLYDCTIRPPVGRHPNPDPSPTRDPGRDRCFSSCDQSESPPTSRSDDEPPHGFKAAARPRSSSENHLPPEAVPMQQRLVRMLPFLLLAAGIPAATRAQQAAADLTVIVADTATGQPIPGASVTAGRARPEPNARGEAVFRALPAGAVTVEARRLGYLAGRAQ